MQRTQNNCCADEIHFVRQQRSDWNPYKRKDLKYERNLRDESGISALIHKSKAWCLMCCCRNRTRDAEAVRQKQADSPLCRWTQRTAVADSQLSASEKQQISHLFQVFSKVFSRMPMARLGQSVMWKLSSSSDYHRLGPLSFNPSGHDKAVLQSDWRVRPELKTKSWKQNRTRFIDFYFHFDIFSPPCLVVMILY